MILSDYGGIISVSNIIDIIAKNLNNNEEQSISKNKQYKSVLKTIMSIRKTIMSITSMDFDLRRYSYSRKCAECVIRQTKDFTESLKMGAITSIMSIRSPYHTRSRRDGNE